MQERIVRVLESDPELGESLDPVRFERALPEAIAKVRHLPAGTWEEPDWPEEVRSGYGLLLLDGLLVRRVHLGGRDGGELLSAGDLLRPWQREDASASVMRSSGWRVLDRAEVAVLDIRFAQRVSPYPEIASQLMARTLRRARNFAVIMTIVHQRRVDVRLLMLLWHLADRCGRVGPNGVLVPMRLTHAILAELLAARRPTISAALGSLEREELLEQTSAGWLLHGSPPGEMAVIADAG